MKIVWQSVLDSSDSLKVCDDGWSTAYYTGHIYGIYDKQEDCIFWVDTM